MMAEEMLPQLHIISPSQADSKPPPDFQADKRGMGYLYGPRTATQGSSSSPSDVGALLIALLKRPQRLLPRGYSSLLLVEQPQLPP